MDQPIIFFLDNLEEQYLASVQKMASTYELLTPDTLSPEDLERIEIIYGFDNEWFNKHSKDQLPQLKWIQLTSNTFNDVPAVYKEDPLLLLSDMSGLENHQLAEDIFTLLLCYYKGVTDSKHTYTLESSAQTLEGKKVYLEEEQTALMPWLHFFHMEVSDKETAEIHLLKGTDKLYMQDKDGILAIYLPKMYPTYDREQFSLFEVNLRQYLTDGTLATNQYKINT